MKKILTILLFLIIFICGCSKSQETFEETTTTKEIETTKTSSNENESAANVEQTTENIQTEETTTVVIEEATTQLEEQTVEIVFTMISFDESESIDDYVSSLNESNGNNDFYVYDNEHYAYKATETERQDFLTMVNNGELSNQFVQSMETDYPDVFKKTEYLSDTKEFKVYVDKELYFNADFGIDIVANITGSMYAEMIQAYNLIPISERVIDVSIIDISTNESIQFE